MTSEEIKNLPKPAKQAAVKAYTDLGFSVRRIAELLGINPKTVLKYQDKELDKEWEQFGNTIKKIYLEQDFELAELAYKKMKEKINKARFYELVGLYKTVRELQQPQVGTAVQVNITPILGGISRKYESRSNNSRQENSGTNEEN
jgi:predicted transcriptional regulator